MSAKRGKVWVARWREWPGGPQRYKTFTTKREADLHEAAMRVDLAEGRYLDPSAGRESFDRFADRYLVAHAWRPATATRATSIMAHARKAWGPRPLSSLGRSDVQAFINGLDMAPSSKATVLQRLSALFAMAVEDGALLRNPCKGVKVPRGASGEVIPPTMDEVRALHEAAPGPFKAAVLVGAGLGLRQSELRGLTVDRVAFLRREVTVDRQADPSGEGFAPTKTERSNRVVPAADVILDELAAHLGAYGSGDEGHLLHSSGGPYGYGAFNVAWRDTTSRAGVDVRFHDLRHHCASQLLGEGLSLVAVAKVLGDSQVTVLRTYGHLVPGDEDRVRAAINRLWTPSRDDVALLSAD